MPSAKRRHSWRSVDCANEQRVTAPIAFLPPPLPRRFARSAPSASRHEGRDVAIRGAADALIT